MAKKKVITGYQVRNKHNDGIRFASCSLSQCQRYCPYGCAVWSVSQKTYGIKLRFFWQSPFRKIGYDKYCDVINFFCLHVGWELMKRDVPMEIAYDPKDEPMISEK